MENWQWVAEAQWWFLDGVWSFWWFFSFFGDLLVAILVVWVFVVIARRVASFVAARIKSNSIVDDEYTWKVSALIWEIIFYTLLVFALLIWFTIVWIDFGRIMWWISFWIWFAFKDILWNLMAWVLLLTNKEFKLWDVVVVDDNPNEYFGRIEEITIRYTVIRTFDLRKVIVPNLTMVTQPVRTYDSEDVVRLDTLITVHYWTDIPQAIEMIKEAVNSVEFVKEHDNTYVTVEQFAWSGIDLRVYFYFDPKGWINLPRALSQIHTAVFAMFNEQWIVIPYPHTTLTVDYNDKNLLSSMIYVAQEGKKWE